MKPVLSAAVAMCLTGASAHAQGQPVQWRVEDGGNGHWYARLDAAMDFLSARAAAQSLGAELATCSSAEEWARIAAAAAAPPLQEPYFWIGLYQDQASPEYSEPAGAWRWVDGTSTAFSAWNGGEPNNTKQIEHFAHGFFSSGVALWNDGPGSNTYVSVIEWSADCNSDGIVDYGQIRSGQLPDSDSNGVPDTCEAPPCPGDITGNGQVNGVDLSAVLTSWGTNGQSEFGADINGDGTVDGLDLTVVLAGWGPCPSSLAWATVIESQPDPSVVTDANLRAAITSTGLPWRVRDNASQIEMLLVPPGSYMRGCSPGDPHCQSWESPRHHVTLNASFYLGRYEVTQAQWLAIAGFNPSQYQHFPESPLLPVERVSPPIIGQSFLAVTGLRLPTDAEWEYACRAGTTTAYFNGSNDMFSVDPIMWNLGNSGNRPWPVGTKAANALGLHDMLGNIWEWCSDIYGAYGSEPLIDPTGPAGPPTADRVLRGGSFGDLWFVAYRSSYRAAYPYTQQEGGVGFRVARDP